MIAAGHERKTACLVLVAVVVCLCGPAGCGFFGDENSDTAKQATASRAAAAPAKSSYGDLPSFTADQWLDLSLSYHRQGKYLEAIAAAQTALYLKPDYAEAYNNIGAAYASLQMWDLAIQAAQQALRLKPDFPLARNNLAWAVQQKQNKAR